MNLEDWQLSKDLNGEITNSIIHKSVLNVPDHGPFLHTLLFLLSLLLFEIGCVAFLQSGDLCYLVLLGLLEFFDIFGWNIISAFRDIYQFLGDLVNFILQFILRLVLMNVSLIKDLGSIFHSRQQDEHVT